MSGSRKSLELRFERWGEFAGPDTWPRMGGHSPATRMMHHWPELPFLHARQIVKELDPQVFPHDHLRVRIQESRITPRKSRRTRLNFDHYFSGEDLREDATLFNDALYRNIDRVMPRRSNPKVYLYLLFFSGIPIAKDPNGPTVRVELLCWTRPWL